MNGGAPTGTTVNRACHDSPSRTHECVARSTSTPPDLITSVDGDAGTRSARTSTVIGMLVAGGMSLGVSIPTTRTLSGPLRVRVDAGPAIGIAGYSVPITTVWAAPELIPRTSTTSG